VFACVLGGALLGMRLRGVVSKQLSEESKDLIRLAMGMVATMTALVLGLLLTSSKSSLDVQNTALKHAASDILTLDRLLVRFGSETAEIRSLLRRAVVWRLNATWPEYHAGSTAVLESPGATGGTEHIEDRIRALAPQTDTQRSLQTQALAITGGMMETRWLVFTSVSSSSVPMPFFVVLVLWLTILFSSYGLFSPRNLVVTVIVALCAVSVSSAVFLIFEMDRPFDGLMKVSDAPLRYALAHLK